MKYDCYEENGSEVVELTLEESDRQELAYDGVTSVETDCGKVVIKRE